MTDVQRFVKMINGGYSCISIVTHEEHDTLEIVRQAAMALKREVLIWSMGYGVRDGLLAGSPAEPETDTAGPGLCGLAAAQNGTICVTLDLVEHLKNDLTCRVLRDTIDRIDINGCVLVMIDNEDKLPLVIGSYTKRFDMDKLADNSQGYSGAEIEQAVVSSLHLAFADKHDIDTAMIISVLKSSPPLSVTMAEKIDALCQWANGRCVPAD